MKLAAGIENIQAPFWGRFVNLIVFRGKDVALVDTGLAGMPAQWVVPALHSMGLTPQDLSLIIITHAHADHIGGNAELWLASGKKARFAAHRLEKAWIEQPASQTRQAFGRFADLGLIAPDECENVVKVSGDGVKLDYALEGGEIFNLGNGLELEVVFAPGHTAGNICVLERKNKVLIQAETVLGAAQHNAQGEFLDAPVYEDDVAAYLRTIALVARLDCEVFVPSHLPLMNRQEAARFLDESLDFTLRFEAEVRQRLQSSSQPLTSLELWRSMDKLWGRYTADLALYILLETHLKSMVKRGLVRGTLTEGLTWVGPDRDGLASLAQAARAAIRGMSH